jgi:hypothetical protein
MSRSLYTSDRFGIKRKKKKGSNNDSESSLLEMRLLLCNFCGFSFCRLVLSVNKGEGPVVQWKGGITEQNMRDRQFL